MDRISDPRVSPDGTRVAFTVRTTDFAGNRGRNDVWIAATDGSGVRRLTSHEASDTQARWSTDGRTLFFVSTRTGSAQVFRIPADGGEAEQVDAPAPGRGRARRWRPGDDGFCSRHARLSGTHPRRDADSARREGESEGERPRLRPPVRPALGHLGGRDTESPLRLRPRRGQGHRPHARDGRGQPRQAVRRQRGLLDLPGRQRPWSSPPATSVREEAWSTNLDLFTVPLDASAPPRKITTNPATDDHPRFSPDGKTLAYLAMSRAGYEADRYRIVLRDWASGTGDDARPARGRLAARGPLAIGPRLERGRPRAAHDRGAPRPAAGLRHGGGRPGRTRILVIGDGQTSDPQPAAGGSVLFGRNSLLGPAELHTVARDGQRPASRHPAERREGRGRALRRAGAAHVRRARGATPCTPGWSVPSISIPPEEVPRRLPRPRRAPGLVRQRLPLPLEPPGLRGRGLRRAHGGLPRLHRLRPGLHRRHPGRLGRQALRGPHEGPRPRARPLPVPGREPGVVR